MSCDEKIVNNGRDEKAQRKQYPDYITYLKNREADKFFNQAMIAEVARADAEVMGNDASAANQQFVMEEPEDLLQLVLGMASPSMFRDLFAGAAAVKKESLAGWFDEKTGGKGPAPEGAPLPARISTAPLHSINAGKKLAKSTTVGQRSL